MEGDWEHVEDDYFAYEMDSEDCSSEDDSEDDEYANTIIEKCSILEEVVDDMINNIVDDLFDDVESPKTTHEKCKSNYNNIYKYVFVVSIALGIGACILSRYNVVSVAVKAK